MLRRLSAFLAAYLVVFAGCYFAAYQLRFDFNTPAEFREVFWRSLPLVLVVKVLVGLATNEWRRDFRYATLIDVLWIVGTAGLAACILFALNAILHTGLAIPRSVILIDALLTVLVCGLLRIGLRLHHEAVRPLFGRKNDEDRTVIYGATTEAIALLRAMQASGARYRVVGFVTDQQSWGRTMVAGRPAYSLKRYRWKRVARKLRVQHVLVPSSVPGKRVREILAACSQAGLKAHVIPAVHEIVSGRFRFTVRDVEITDLLRREPARLDMQAIRGYISGQKVLVTGAAGSIGSELCRQILDLQPASLLMLDQSEYGVFQLERELRDRVGTDSQTVLRFVIGDVLDSPSLERLMEEYRPQLVFHAAAYKHVPLMESNPTAAVRNNVLGTRHVADLSHRCGVRRFVLISTDKAVRPSSVMGATKLVAEKYVQALSSRSRTDFVTVRFGNVLNSVGSVVPIFRKQIERGGPVTVTHPDMERFFMTIPEAVQLVLQAGAIGQSGDLLVLEMGDPVRIVDLARDMISLSGLRCPDDIEIVYTGIRPGEKLREELFYDREEGTKKVHDKIFCAASPALPFEAVAEDVARLEAASRQSDEQTHVTLAAIVARYVTFDASSRPETLQPAA